MSDEMKSRMSLSLPSIQPKPPLTTQSYSRSVEEAPYRALAGFVAAGRNSERHHISPGHRVRRQTGLTNRWRLPESLYSDLLGSSQALKAINMPFNQSLVETITSGNTTFNPMLLTCKDFAQTNEHNWSWLAKHSKLVKKSNEEEEHSQR